jgi:membrane protease YdiL (CAAX protease family)
MSEERSNLVPIVILSELALAVLALIWGHFRDLHIELGLNLRSVIIGIIATIFPLSVNFVLFGRAADIAAPLKQFSTFRDDIASPLVTGLGGQQTLLISVLAGLGEELLFRGVLHIEVGIHLSVLLFAILHFGPEIRRFYWVFLVYIAFGYYFAALLMVSGGLLAPMVCHTLYDYLAIRWLERRNQLPTS